MTLKKRVGALEGQAKQGLSGAEVEQGAALFRAKLSALTDTTLTEPCSPEEVESLRARIVALAERAKP